MKTMRIYSAAAAICFLSACVHREAASTLPTAKQAADKGLQDFKDHMSDTVATILGFKDVSEGKRSGLGEPIRVFEPACRQVLGVKDTAQSVDPRASSSREMYYYPILGDGGRKVSLILVTRLNADSRVGKAGEWITSQVGAKTLMGKLDAVLVKNPKEKMPSQFVLQFNALGLAFLGYEEGNDVRLTPVSLTDSANACLGTFASGAGRRTTNVFAALSRCYDIEQICAEVSVPSVLAAADGEKEHKVIVTKNHMF